MVLGFSFPDVGSRSFQPIERGFARVARRRTLAVFLVGTAALVLRDALSPIEPLRKPTAQDEFSYPLAADTFAHGSEHGLTLFLIKAQLSRRSSPEVPGRF